MSASLTAFGLALNAWGLPSPFILSWNWITFFAFVTFVVLVYWGWYSTHLQLKQIEENRPVIEVILDSDENAIKLHVKNLGSVAEFKAQGRIKGDTSFYDIPWGDSGIGEKTIFHNATEVLSIASRFTTPSYDQSKPYIGLLTATNERQSQFPYSRSLTPDISEVTIEVNITSNPQLSKAFNQTYKIKLNKKGLEAQIMEVKK